MRKVVLREHKGREVEVDARPTCQHCGRRVGDYFGLPWSVRCPECRKQASSSPVDIPDAGRILTPDQ